MSRLTINVNDDTHQALKEMSARTGRTIGKIIEESLILRGVRSFSSAKDLVAKARTNANLSEEHALDLALRETKQSRIAQKKN